MNEPIVHVFPTLDELVRAAADRTVRLIQATSPDVPFSIALSGGHTPEGYHRELATTYRETIPWERIHLFWGDERFVPLDHPDSNYRMAYDTLIRHVPIPPANVHPVPVHLDTPDAAATSYEEELRRFFEHTVGGGFDLMLLGMGADGHTASLFPGSLMLDEKDRWVVSTSAPENAPVRERITLTYPILNRSDHVFFLVSGADKCDPADAIIHRRDQVFRYPAARVTTRNPVVWFVDRAAAGLPSMSGQ